MRSTSRQHVHAARRHGHRPSRRPPAPAPKPRRRQDAACTSASGTVTPSRPDSSRTAQREMPRRDRHRVGSRPPGRRRARRLWRRAGRRRAPSASSGRLGSTPRSNRVLASVLSPSALLVRRTESAVERGALEDDGASCRRRPRNRRRPSRRPPPSGPTASAITSMSGASVRVWPSSVARRSPGRGRAARGSSRAAELREVEGVHRLAEFEQHVVGDVHHVADRAHAERCAGAPAASPARRRR